MIPRWIIGVVINCTGSVAINLGVVLMKLSHKLHRSKVLGCDDEPSSLDGPVTSETGLIDRRKADKSRRQTTHRSRESLDEMLPGEGDSFSKNFDSYIKGVWSDMLSGNKKYWYLGGGSFLLGTIINFSSMSYAPQSLLSSLGSVQFVSNCVFGKLILKV